MAGISEEYGAMSMCKRRAVKRNSFPDIQTKIFDGGPQFADPLFYDDIKHGVAHGCPRLKPIGPVGCILGAEVFRGEWCLFDLSKPWNYWQKGV